MPRWLIPLVATVVGLPLLATALLPSYVGSTVLHLRHPGWEWLYAVATFVLLVVAIFAIVKIETTLLRRGEARATARNAGRLAAALAELGRDPRLARWVPLAERQHRVDRAEVERWEARYQSLLADPRRRGFAERALHGELPSDDEIDYLLDPGARRTCAHLQPVEAALRDAGIACGVVVAPQGTTLAVVTDARLDAPALRTRFDLPTFVEWQVTPPEPHDAGSERLVCARCDSWIESGRGASFPPA